jgi:Ca2+-binding RTX toxin-like protein
MRRLPLWSTLTLGTVLLLAGALAAVSALAGARAAGHSQRCFGKRATISSSARRIVGTRQSDVIVVGNGGGHGVEGLGGRDRICGGSGNDAIDGGRGADRISAGAGNDRLLGGKGPDTLQGDSGSDFIDGQLGGDELLGGAGKDVALGEKGNDQIDGGGGSDRAEGGPGDDSARGGVGQDFVFGGAGSDRADGGPGNGDVVQGDAGTDDLLGGGGGADIASFASATRRGVTVDLATNAAKGDGHDDLGGFEDVVGSPQGDTLLGDAGANVLDGGLGDDTLSGGGGGDAAFGGAGSDACTGFTTQSSCGPESPPPAGAAYVALDQSLAGSSLVVQGSPGADQLSISGAASDWTVAGSGRLFAGEGCADSAPGATVRCSGSLAVSLVVATGREGDDTIAVAADVPGNVSVRINGNAGSDTIVGGAGSDLLEAGENYKNPDDGRDTLIGNGGGDVLYADPGADRLAGGSGNDLLVSSVASCQGHGFDGGPGQDTVSYARSNAGVEVSLGGVGGPQGCGTPDRVLGSNERLEGSDSPDVLVGDAGDNSLIGHLGADTLIGRAGEDLLDAADGQRDAKVDCGPSSDDAQTDRLDPAPLSC